MNEKILRLLISIIPTILIIACVVAAFATNDWNVQTTVLGVNPLKTLETLMPAQNEVGGEFLEVTDSRLSGDGTKLIVEAMLHSPLGVSVTIKEMYIEFILGESAVTLRLPEEVKVPAKGSASLTLEGSTSEVPTQITLPSMEQFTLGGMGLTLDIGGIELKLENLGLGGVG